MYFHCYSNLKFLLTYNGTNENSHSLNLSGFCFPFFRLFIYLQVLVASDISFLMAVVFREPCRLRWLGGGTPVFHGMYTQAGISCLMSAAGVSLGLHARRGMHVANRDCSSVFFVFKLLGLSHTDEIYYRKAPLWH